MSTPQMITQEYDLNMIPGGIPIRVHVNQYDSMNRTLQFNLYAGGSKYNIPAGADVNIVGTPTGGEPFEVPATMAGNTANVDVQNVMTQVPGEVKCWVQVTAGGTQVASAEFTLVVHRCGANDPLTLERYYYLGDVPSGYRPGVDAALASGAMNGYSGEGEETVVKLSKDMCRMLMIMGRTGAFDPYFEE